MNLDIKSLLNPLLVMAKNERIYSQKNYMLAKNNEYTLTERKLTIILFHSVLKHIKKKINSTGAMAIISKNNIMAIGIEKLNKEYEEKILQNSYYESNMYRLNKEIQEQSWIAKYFVSILN